MVKMDDVRAVGKGSVVFSLDGSGPSAYKNLEAEKEKRFREPTGRDVFRSIRHQLEKGSEDDSMVVNVEAGRLIAFRIEAGDKETEWQRVPPVDGWRKRDASKGYHYFFVIEPEIGWGDMLYRGFTLSDEYKEKYQKPGDYIGVMVQTPGSTEDFRLSTKNKEDGFRVGRCGFTKECENKIISSAFGNPNISVGGNVTWAEDGVWLNIGGKNVNLYFNWPDTVEGDTPQLKPITDIKNRMALMTIGGDFLPDSYREDRVRWSTFSENGQTLVEAIRNENDFLFEEQVTEVLERLIQPENINQLFILDDPIAKLTPAVNVGIGDSHVGAVLHDTLAVVCHGLRVGNGRYQLGNWTFELALNSLTSDIEQYQVDGLKLTNARAPGVELILTNTSPQLVGKDGISTLVSEIDKIKVDRVILRSTPIPSLTSK